MTISHRRRQTPGRWGSRRRSHNALKGFPFIVATGYGYPAGGLFNGGALNESTLYSHSVSASMSRLAGRHTVKVGGDYRRIGMSVLSVDSQNGSLVFTPAFTAGPNPNATTGGDTMASLLLGYPAGGGYVIATPNRFFTNYVGGYVQDDFRLRSNVSVNLGVRYEFEQGLREANNAFTVGFDRERSFPVQVPGLNLKGGLMYAGVDGYPTSQGHPSHLNFGPRGGIAWSLDARTVVRGGYGLFWAPSQIPQALGQAALGTRGFTGSTIVRGERRWRVHAVCGLLADQPVPAGLRATARRRTGTADRRRRRHRLRRAVRRISLRAPVPLSI